MKLDEFRLCVRPGNGLVARFATSVLVVTGADWAGMPAVDRLLEECRTAQPQRPLPQRLAALVEDCGAQKVPAFCAIADDADGLALFVHGDSQVVITGAQPVMRLSGGGTAGWTGGIHDRVASLAVGAATRIPEFEPTDDRVDLRDGTVPGGAILLVPRDRVATAPEADPRRDPAAPPTPDPLPPVMAPLVMAPPVMAPPVIAPPVVAPPVTAPPVIAPPVIAPPEPLAAPTATKAVPAAALDGEPVMVWGVHCKRGHFNNPDARYCRMCGTHMVHQNRDPVLGPRPVLGFLVVDDGSTYKLDADYVVGRTPEIAPSVQSGEARGLGISDPEDTVSPTHTAIRLDKWDVFLSDLQSRYGTHIWKPGTSGWERLEPGQTVMLEPRTHLLFGRRTVVFDSVNRR